MDNRDTKKFTPLSSEVNSNQKKEVLFIAQIQTCEKHNTQCWGEFVTQAHTSSADFKSSCL